MNCLVKMVLYLNAQLFHKPCRFQSG
uniref:Uncharacterized protein n=1 Tax=Anguilla anguilla TaxID=7936 RepID=A0A0E9QIB9_ANGAN